MQGETVAAELSDWHRAFLLSMGSRLRGNDKQTVIPAQAGTHGTRDWRQVTA